jgi:hypothetical protein
MLLINLLLPYYFPAHGSLANNLKNSDTRQNKKRGITRPLFDPQMPLALLLFTNAFDFVQILELLLVSSSSEFRGKFSLF